MPSPTTPRPLMGSDCGVARYSTERGTPTFPAAVVLRARAGRRDRRGAARRARGQPRRVPLDRRARVRGARTGAVARLLRRARDERPAALAAGHAAALRRRAEA